MFHVKPPTNYLSIWQGEITDQEPGPEEGEVTLTIQVTHPERRAGRQVRVTVHHDALLDMLDMTE